MKKKYLAPILITVYNRPKHVLKTIEALRKNHLASESDLFIYADGAKYGANTNELGKISEVRELVDKIEGFKSVTVKKSENNIGLLNSFVRGITEILINHEYIIVLEDDQITSKGFLKYMNETLKLYINDDRVMHVSGYMYPLAQKPKHSTFFLNIQSCPGWGTWKRAWSKYNHDADDHINFFSQHPKEIKKFNLDDNSYFYQQLLQNKGNINYSFAVRWYASCFRENGLSLFPSKSLVMNIGLDGSGEHCGPSDMYLTELVDEVEVYKVPIEEDTFIKQAMSDFYEIKLSEEYGIIKKSALSIFKSNLKKYIRSVLRKSLVKILPELSFLTNEEVLKYLKGSKSNSDISEKAKLILPYCIENSSISDYTYVLGNSNISDATIGKCCSIGNNFTCGGGSVPKNSLSTSEMFYDIKKKNGFHISPITKGFLNRRVEIGNDVFIGSNVVILNGIKIGNGAIIGAGSIITKDIPDYSISYGMQGEVKSYRFSKEVIEKLKMLKWWEKGDIVHCDIEKNIFDVSKYLKNNENTSK
jgi:acetyltransferase-like isoleucine patch superfamily enzyme